MVPFVGLTGGIGAGKSVALDALGRLGAATLSTDQVVHDLYETDEVRDAVVERFGPDVAEGQPVRCRRSVLAMVFSPARCGLTGCRDPRRRTTP